MEQRVERVEQTSARHDKQQVSLKAHYILRYPPLQENNR